LEWNLKAEEEKKKKKKEERMKKQRDEACLVQLLLSLPLVLSAPRTSAIRPVCFVVGRVAQKPRIESFFLPLPALFSSIIALFFSPLPLFSPAPPRPPLLWRTLRDTLGPQKRRGR